MEFFAIGALILWMGVAIVGVHLLRRRRRRDMGLPPLEQDWRNGVPSRYRVPKDNVGWSKPTYHGSTRRRP